MVKSVVARAFACAVACVFFVSATSAQDGGSSPTDGEAPALLSGASTPLPNVVVTAPKQKKKAKKEEAAGKSQGGGGSADNATGEAATQDSGGIGGVLDSDVKVDGVMLSGPAISDTGTTVFDSTNVRIRTDGSGDSNTFLRNLPNVQYQDDTSTTAGETLQSTIDTRPLLLSINGGRTYENNFILNGVSINTITGPIERSAATMSDTDGTPNADIVYGLHPQTVFVPSEFLGSATVIDSNASAEYGEFQGGVVVYDLAKPPTDRYRASINYSRHTDSMVNYVLATPTGTNPLDRKHPTFTKNNLAVSIGAPITSDLSFIAQASRKTAETSKQKDYKLFDGWVDEESENTFLRFATTVRTGIGKFTFDTSFTDYVQNWQSPTFREMHMDVETQSSSTQIEYAGALRDISHSAIGLGGVTLKSRAYYNDSDTGNYTNSNEAYAPIGYRRRKVAGVWEETFDSTEFTDWCRPVPTDALDPTVPDGRSDNTICNYGGYGNKEQGQTDIGIMAQLRGNVFLGNFLLGAEAKNIEGRRARLEDFTYYSGWVTATGQTATPLSPAGGVFHCEPGDELCSSEQYNRVKTIWEAFDVTRDVNAFHGYAELDQTLGWFNVRTGVRVDYEDYFKNLNVAPRLVGTITPFSGLSISGGYNRYYLGETLYYALRDAQPRGQAYQRPNHDADGNVSPIYNQLGATGGYGYLASDLDTPFRDEYTAGIRIRDPFLQGQWRFRYVERFGRDLFSSVSCGSNCRELTNDGESFYRAATAEYTKMWSNLSTPFMMSGAAITGGITWSEQTISRNTYHDDDDSEIRILYNGQSYTPQSFTAVTGNLDIPVRVGATFATTWFNDRLFLALSAGYNFGYEGVYDTGQNEVFEGRPHDVWDDHTFKSALMLDLAGEIAITEQAGIEFQVNNLLNSAGNSVANNQNPWVRGRSYWVGSTVRF